MLLQREQAARPQPADVARAFEHLELRAELLHLDAVQRVAIVARDVLARIVVDLAVGPCVRRLAQLVANLQVRPGLLEVEVAQRVLRRLHELRHRPFPKMIVVLLDLRDLRVEGNGLVAGAFSQAPISSPSTMV